MPKGTYVGIRVLPDSAKKLKEFCIDVGIPIKSTTFDRRLHSTIIYSKVYCPELVADPDYIVTASFDGFDLFTDTDTGASTVLVAKLFCPELEVRHRYLMATHGATFDYPNYAPHITLSYSYHDSIDDLPDLGFPIKLGMEYVEDLRFDWTANG